MSTVYRISLSRQIIAYDIEESVYYDALRMQEVFVVRRIQPANGEAWSAETDERWHIVLPTQGGSGYYTARHNLTRVD